MNRHAHRLFFLDLLQFVTIAAIMLIVYPSYARKLSWNTIVIHLIFLPVVLFSTRLLMGMYRYIWRYVRNSEYLKLIFSDFCAGIIYFVLQKLFPIEEVTFLFAVELFCINLLFAVSARLFYQYLYDARSRNSKIANSLRAITSFVTGIYIEPQSTAKKINVAVVGAGRVGVGLMDELLTNPSANYYPVCFIDIDQEKVGRSINGIPVIPEAQATLEKLDSFSVQEVVIALPEMDLEKRRQLYVHYREMGCKVKTYDFPTAHNADSKRSMREFDIEELLFRRPEMILEERTKNYYTGKTVLISGGGGSIGSELARQIAQMQPGKLVILDVYENGAYDIQQELRLKYKNLVIAVEIVTITDRAELKKAFERHKPDIVLHAAAHKHVPLMENNSCEAVKNNVFGTKNIVDVAEECGTGRFIMISTDKAVNPTNVMGATKRMCEMIVLAHPGNMKCSATRFGNVLGSNGSVIPLFRRQIQEGGPITITDKRIIRYFMTIPEASQLVLTSGAMAKHGELFVLDMGQPVKILDLAEGMLRLSGMTGIDIVETGLRPGEKLYEELLIHTEELDKTDNAKIFIERDAPVEEAEVEKKLELLARAVAEGDDEGCRKALKQAVPTFRDPEEVNREAKLS